MTMDFAKVNESVEKFIKEIGNLDECTKRFTATNEQLTSWKGGAKDALESEIKRCTPKFDELVEVVSSYAIVAKNASNSYSATDTQLMKEMLG